MPHLALQRILLPGVDVKTMNSGKVISGLGKDALAQGGMDALGTIKVPSGGLAAITFGGIPSGYNHIQLRVIFRDNRANTGSGSYAQLTFNGDSSGIYAYHQIYGSGTTAGAAQNINQTSIEVTRVSDNGASSGVFGSNIIDIYDYDSDSKTKTVRGFGGYDNNGTGAIYIWSGLWNSTAPIETLTITDGGGTLFLENSQFALYGVK